MSDLYTRFFLHIQPFSHTDICVALSGGVDSVVLLHLLKRLQKENPFTLSAIHIHHGLNPAADDWQNFCFALCSEWNIPYCTQKVSVSDTSLGIEAAARKARYRAFGEEKSPVIALAHHQNDQHETFFLAALRGGGLRALSAMPKERAHLSQSQTKQFWRPLLPFTRQEIEDYARFHQLSWIHDNSNDNTEHYLRNFLRQNTLPELSKRIPHFAQQINASIAALQNDLTLLNEYTAEEYAKLHLNQQWQRHLWLNLSETRQHHQLAYFCQQHHLGSPTRKSILDFARVLRESQTAQWSLPQGIAILYQNVLLPLPHHFENNWFWLQKPLSGSLKTVCQSIGQNSETLSKHQQNQTVRLRAAQKTDRLSIHQNHHQSVYKILQQNGVPHLLRPLWPVFINDKEETIAIFNLRVAHAYQHQNWQPEIAFLNTYRAQKIQAA